MAGDLPAQRTDGSLDLGLIGALVDLLFAAGLAGFLLAATNSPGDAVPRPLLLAALWATPGVVGLLGAYARSRSVLVGAAIPLFPAALLSWAGVTLVFALPGVLMIAGAAAIPSGRRRLGAHLPGIAQGALISVLIVIAGWASLLGLTRDGCFPTAGGTVCGSAFISVEGTVVAGGCLGVAIALAGWSALDRVRAHGSPAPL